MLVLLHDLDRDDRIRRAPKLDFAIVYCLGVGGEYADERESDVDGADADDVRFAHARHLGGPSLCTV